MVLTPEENELFFKLWYSLLWHINEKEKIVPHFEKPLYHYASGTKASLDIQEIMQIRNAMWEQPSYIDDFLAEHGRDELSEEEYQIIADWRQYFIEDQFIITKHLKKYSVLLLSNEDEEISLLYAVYGITNSLKESIPYPLPLVIDTVLLPFKNKIIYDSLAIPYDVGFDKYDCNEIRQVYKEIKEEQGIIESLNPLQKSKIRQNKNSATSKNVQNNNVPKKMEAKYLEIAELIENFCTKKT